MRSTGTGKELMLGKLLSLDARNKIRAEEEAEDDEASEGETTSNAKAQ